MKTSVAVTLGSGVAAVVLAAYLVSYATTVRDPVEFKDGDLIVQNSDVENILPVFASDGSGLTHVGIVEVSPEGAVVIEAADKVRETPVHEYLKRSEGYGFAVYRVASLTDEQRKQVVNAARLQIGKPNDFFLGKSWDQLYSAELVRLAYGDIGLEVGRLQRINRVATDIEPVKSRFSQAWSANEECHRRNLDQTQCWALVSKQEVVTPASIVSDERVTKVYEVANQQQGFTLSRGPETPVEEKKAP